MTALILKPPGGPNKTFVLFDDDRPVGTAGLMRGDLESRPDLTPWLGGLYVEPAFRSRGHATTLVRQVEDAARAVSVSV
ncbi:GNAT family N-acetyltransferase, partial [Klebsiella pneumoniae]|nr:GNAT family N-acetyltransferase [Klebsiella pneumoniae]